MVTCLARVLQLLCGRTWFGVVDVVVTFGVGREINHNQMKNRQPKSDLVR